MPYIFKSGNHSVRPMGQHMEHITDKEPSDNSMPPYRTQETDPKLRSASPSSDRAYYLYFFYDGLGGPSGSGIVRANGLSVRCLQVIDEVAEP